LLADILAPIREALRLGKVVGRQNQPLHGSLDESAPNEPRPVRGGRLP
jgi:hypothetical protein